MQSYHIDYLIELVRKDIARYRAPGTHFGQTEKAIVEEMNQVMENLIKMKKGEDENE